MGGLDPLWYITMSFRARRPMETSLVGAKGSDREPELGSKVGYSVDFSLGCLGSRVGSAEGFLLRDSRGLYFSLHRWELSVSHYHKIMVIYPYPFFVVITLLFSCIIFINYCICILTGSPV